MNIIDGLIFLLMAYYCYRGLKNGLVWEAFSLVGVIVSIFFSFYLMSPVTDLVQFRFGISFELLPYVIFGLIFLFLLISFQIIIYATNELFRIIFLSTINRILGMVMAALKGAVLTSIILLVLTAFNFPDEQMRAESMSYSFFEAVAPTVYDSLASIYPDARSYTESVIDTIERYKSRFEEES